MSVSQALATPVDETVESMELAPRNGFHLEPRCRAEAQAVPCRISPWNLATDLAKSRRSSRVAAWFGG
jgi:hypothetical protein